MFELKYENKFGEVMTLKYDGDFITWNHDDIHDEDEFQQLRTYTEVILNESELKVIRKFMEMVRIVEMNITT